MHTKCVISDGNHCEIDWKRLSTRDPLNAIIHSAGCRRPYWITGTRPC